MGLEKVGPKVYDSYLCYTSNLLHVYIVMD